jgi:hypothetical protein
LCGLIILAALTIVLLVVWNPFPQEVEPNTNALDDNRNTNAPIAAVNPQPRTTPTSKPVGEDTGVSAGNTNAHSGTINSNTGSVQKDGVTSSRVIPVYYYILAAFIPLLLWLLYELWLYAKKKLMLHRERSKRPPYIVPLKQEPILSRLYDSPEFYHAVRRMRRRQADEFKRLDVWGTVAATVQAAGFPSFRYKQVSKAPEYLILIHRVSERDHQAQLFRMLVEAFAREHLFIVHYFYDDPRVCTKDSDQESVRLAEIQRKYSTRRLLIFSDGQELLDPMTGELATWTSVFRSWRERALLTPTAPAAWGWSEAVVGDYFRVLPANTQGLSELLNQLETTAPTSFDSWRRNDTSLPVDEAELEEVVTRADWAALKQLLTHHLGSDLFQWLCATAFYPHLEWNLTLRLGTVAGMPGSLVTEENLLRLTRLPWFRSGRIPEQVREQLVSWLAPDKVPGVQQHLVNVLDATSKVKKYEGTHGADVIELNLAVWRWLRVREGAESLWRKFKELRHLWRKLRELPPSLLSRDQVLLRMLESTPKSALDFIIPPELGQHIYKRGVAVFGVRSLVRFSCALAIALTATLALVPFLPRTESAGSVAVKDDKGDIAVKIGSGNDNNPISQQNTNNSNGKVTPDENKNDSKENINRRAAQEQLDKRRKPRVPKKEGTDTAGTTQGGTAGTGAGQEGTQQPPAPGASPERPTEQPTEQPTVPTPKPTPEQPPRSQPCPSLEIANCPKSIAQGTTLRLAAKPTSSLEIGNMYWEISVNGTRLFEGILPSEHNFDFQNRTGRATIVVRPQPPVDNCQQDSTCEFIISPASTGTVSFDFRVKGEKGYEEINPRTFEMDVTIQAVKVKGLAYARTMLIRPSGVTYSSAIEAPPSATYVQVMDSRGGGAPRYRFSNVPPGVYWLTFTSPFYQPVKEEVPVNSRGDAFLTINLVPIKQRSAE